MTDLTKQDLWACSLALGDAFAATDDERFEAALDKVNAEIERREAQGDVEEPAWLSEAQERCVHFFRLGYECQVLPVGDARFCSAPTYE